MKKQNLLLHRYPGGLRTVIKTRHGRSIYLSFRKEDGCDDCFTESCYYLDRVTHDRYETTPKKFKTSIFSYGDLLSIIERNLDRKYYGVEITADLQTLSTEAFIEYHLNVMRRGYKFLIFVGEGAMIDGIPSIIKTRIKNKVHRTIYLEMHYIGDGKGLVDCCCYEDRIYQHKKYVTPETLFTVHFTYTRQAVLNIINRELCADFTDIIFVTDGSLHLENKLPLCGSINY